MDLTDIEELVAVVDLTVRPIVTRRFSIEEIRTLHTRVPPLVEAGLEQEAPPLLEALLERYESGDEPLRAQIRAIFRKNRHFATAVWRRPAEMSAYEFRRQLIHLSALGEVRDPRDTIVGLDGLCRAARDGGVDIAPIVREVAAMSSTEEHVDFGSIRYILLRVLEADSSERTG